MAKEKEKFKPTEVIYMGRRSLKSKKGKEEGVLFITTELFTKVCGDNDASYHKTQITNAVEAAASAFSGTGVIAAAIGGIYEMDCIISPDGRIAKAVPTDLKYKKMADNQIFLGAWQAADRAVFEEKTRRSMERKATKNNELSNAVAVVKAHYDRVNYAQRRSFQLWLLNELDRR